MSRKAIPYRQEELLRVGPQRTFTGQNLSEIAFPLGGIGTGTISLGGRGNLRDFEIFNRPAKGNYLPFTLFALYAKAEGEPPVAKVLEGKAPPPYRGASGEPHNQLLGLPRFSDAVFQGEYPVAILELSDPAIPLKVKLKAWNPFIPLNIKDSALPVAIFEWTFTNSTDRPVDLSLAATTSNPLTAKDEGGEYRQAGSINTYQVSRDLRGILLSHPRAVAGDPRTGTLALSTTWKQVDVQTRFYRGGWWDGCHIFWEDFSSDGRLRPVLDTEPAPTAGDVCGMSLYANLGPRAEVRLPVFLTWHFPVMENPWPAPGAEPGMLGLYVGKHFEDAWSVAQYVADNLDRLDRETELWRKAIFSSTLPSYVMDAATSQASIMRSPTCFLLADGNFFGWEGCRDNAGCCPGNCTHVWNYEQAVAFLFPELERTMRRTEFIFNTRDTGNMGFRTRLPLGAPPQEFKPCADGQMGTIIQVFRDWQLSGDDRLLEEIWPKVKLALEYAWAMTPEKAAEGASPDGWSLDSAWDPDRDGVMEGEQHNTYDIEFFGPNTMCTAMYLGALRACEAIARHFGEMEKAEEYRALFESGRKKVEAELWNGDYYVQKVTVIEGIRIPERLKSPESLRECSSSSTMGAESSSSESGQVMPKYQYGEGCLSDQLLGQWACHVAGLGYLLDPERIRKAVKSIFDNNWLPEVGEFANVQRVYALNEEPGLLLCTWPRGNRPLLPFVYSDEVWTGIEYQVAAHLIYEGWLYEGLAVVKGARERYAGHNRNPWNEIECGHHYARAMSSWSVKLALDGFSFSIPESRLGFAPRIHREDFRTFWSTGTGWGTYSQQPKEGRFRLEVLYGSQRILRLDIADLNGKPIQVEGPRGAVPAHIEGNSIVLEAPLILRAGEALIIRNKS